MPFCDTTLSAEQRAMDLVSRMTLEEKGHNLGGAGGWGGSAGVPRLGVPPAAALQVSATATTIPTDWAVVPLSHDCFY